VAAGLWPSLDTHPGEEMLAAAFRAFDANPTGALTILLPIYGAKFVCAEDAEGGPLLKGSASTRLGILKNLSAGKVDRRQIDACAQEIERTLLESKTRHD
jgi:hypothetical protein